MLWGCGGESRGPSSLQCPKTQISMCRLTRSRLGKLQEERGLCNMLVTQGPSRSELEAGDS